jgi:ribosomal protein S12 methylthiotransferase accessory factor
MSTLRGIEGPSSTAAALRRLQQLIGVTRVADVTSLDRAGVRVCCAIRPAGHILQVSNGKGVHAEPSALSEAAELWAAEQPEPERWTFRDGIAWVRAERLDAAGELWVPAQSVWCLPAGSPSMGPQRERWTSNGLAAHSKLERALLHGLLEVIERHALPDGWTGREPGVAAPFDVPGFTVRAYDLTPPRCPVPVAGALVESEGVLTAGYAARLDADDAVRAACEEAFQSRLTDVQGAREDVAHRAQEIPPWLSRRPAQHRMKDSRCTNLRSLAKALKRPVAYVELVPGLLPLRVVKVVVPGFEVSELLT